MYQDKVYGWYFLYKWQQSMQLLPTLLEANSHFTKKLHNNNIAATKNNTATMHTTGGLSGSCGGRGRLDFLLFILRWMPMSGKYCKGGRNVKQKIIISMTIQKEFCNGVINIVKIINNYDLFLHWLRGVRRIWKRKIKSRDHYN